MSRLRAVLLLVFFGAFVANACSNSRDGLIFTPGVGHPEGWTASHGGSAGDAERDCVECHGDDLMGGISGVSCFAPSLDGVRCHGSGPGTSHSDDDWGNASSHGTAAKSVPSGPGSGFRGCKE